MCSCSCNKTKDLEIQCLYKDFTWQANSYSVYLHTFLVDLCQAVCFMPVSSCFQLEKKKRRSAEKRLRLAEDSLKRLDKALRESGVKIDLEIETDVKNLRGT